MKPITIRNKEFYYKVEFKSLFRRIQYTFFYTKGNNCIFSVPFNIEDPYYTKNQLKPILEEKVQKYLEYKERKLEIERGEII